MRISVLSIGLIPLALMAGTVAYAQTARPIQLDSKEPSEMIVQRDSDFALLAWNPELKKWIEVFSGAGDYKLGSTSQGSFANIVNGGYLWRWDGSRYVPEIPRDDIPELVDLPHNIADAIAKKDGVNVPSTTGAVSYVDADGSTVFYAVLDQDSSTCLGDGTVCTGIIVRDGKPGNDVGAAVGYGYRISQETNAAKHRYLEQGTPDSVIVQDADSGNIIRRIEPKPVKISDMQPAAPTDSQE